LVARADGRRQSASCLRQTALRLWPALPHRTGEYVSGALGRETPQPRHLATSRYGGVVNKAGLKLIALLDKGVKRFTIFEASPSLTFTQTFASGLAQPGAQ